MIKRAKPKYRDWMPSPNEALPMDEPPQGSNIADAQWEGLLNAFRSKAPAQWYQNSPLQLAQKFTSMAFLSINTLAKFAQMSTCKVFERTEDPHESDLELPWTDALCKILERPNDQDYWADLMYQISLQLSLTGTACIWKPTYHEKGIPTELFVIPTATMYPLGASPGYPEGSYIVQPYWQSQFANLPTYQSAAGARIDARQIIRILNPHPILRSNGYATLTAIARQCDTIDAIDNARLSTQVKGIDSSLVITFDPKIYNPDNQVEMTRLRSQLEAMYSGPQNSGRFMPLPAGSEVTTVSNTPKDMAWCEGWKQLADFSLAAFGTPSAVVGLTDSTTYATLYASIKQFNSISLDPHLNRIQNKVNSDYVKPYWGEDLYVKLSSEKIDDEEMTLRYYDLGLRAKSIKRNEVRKLLELPPLDGPEGDELVDAVKENVSIGAVSTNQTQDAQVEQARTDSGNPAATPSNGKMSNKNVSERLALLMDNGKVKGLAAPLTKRELVYVNGE